MISILRSCALFTVAAIAISLAGCLELKQPLSEPMASHLDSGLSGLWTRTDGDSNEKQYYFIGQTKADAGCPPGVMHVIQSTYNESDKDAKAIDVYGYSTTVNDDTYFNLFQSAIQTREQWDAWKQASEHTVMFVQFELNGDELKYNPGDYDAFKAMREEKHLDDPAALVAYLKTDGAAKLFPAANQVVLHRVR